MSSIHFAIFTLLFPQTPAWRVVLVTQSENLTRLRLTSIQMGLAEPPLLLRIVPRDNWKKRFSFLN